jgi:hypothetical protein
VSAGSGEPSGSNAVAASIPISSEVIVSTSLDRPDLYDRMDMALTPERRKPTWTACQVSKL